MKKLIFLGACLCLSGSISFAADQKSVDLSTVELVKVNQSLLQLNASLHQLIDQMAKKSQSGFDPKMFCYHESKAFTEGYRILDMTCVRKKVDSNDAFDQETVLVWQQDVKLQGK